MNRYTKLTMRGGSMRRFSPSPFDGNPQYRGALQMPNVVSGVGKTVKRAVKRKAQGLANRVVDRAANEASLIYWVCKRKKRNVRTDS